MKKLRFVTAASLFDGHDVSINIMRRLLQSKGVEVIHLGHNRSAGDVVNACLQESGLSELLMILEELVKYQELKQELVVFLKLLLPVDKQKL